MKVMIPVMNDSDEKYQIAKGFINANHACIYDTELKTYEWITTDELSKNVGNLSFELKRKGIYTVISTHMPILALGLFVESGLGVFKAHGNKVEENIKLFEDKQLETFTSAMSMTHNGCSPVACGSCSSSSCK